MSQGTNGVNQSTVPPITPAAGVAMVRRQLAAMVGMDCHYVAPGSGDGVYPPICRAAKITEALDLESGQVGLMIMNPGGLHFRAGVHYDPAGASYTWHWPETV